MRLLTFYQRTEKEILRDPLNVAFGIGFPVAVLLLLTVIQANIPVSLFAIERLSPGIAVFGFSFMTLFSATLVSKDRSGALLQRLYATPLKAKDYILGYILPMLPIAAAQSLVCFMAAVCLGLEVSANIVWAVLLGMPSAFFFIALGLLCGSIFNDKQVGGICGALLTNLAAWLSGTWFDLELVGGTFQKIADALPFVHAVELERAVIAGDFSGILPHLWWVLGYAAVTGAAAIFVFTHKMKHN